MNKNIENNNEVVTNNSQTGSAKFDLLELCKEIIRANEEKWTQLTNGKTGNMGYFLGKAMHQCYKTHPTVTPNDVINIYNYLRDSKFLP